MLRLEALSNFKIVMELFFVFLFLCFNFRNRVFGFTISELHIVSSNIFGYKQKIDNDSNIKYKYFYVQIHK